MTEKSGIVYEAELFCHREKERLTKPRLEVLKIIAASSRALGAYEILAELGKVLHQPKPPTAYRAIEFWQNKGFIHRIESLNAYIICQAGNKHKGVQFMICNDCGLVIESERCDLPKNIISDKKFTPSSWHIEVRGLCSNCINKLYHRSR